MTHLHVNMSNRPGKYGGLSAYTMIKSTKNGVKIEEIYLFVWK